VTHYDIALVGSGSGNSFPGPEFENRSIVYIDRGVGPDRIFGGTCLNVGCIPTKMFVHTADVAATPSESSRYGVHETLDSVDWPAIRDRIFGRIDPIVAGGEEYRVSHPDNDNLTLLRGTARFTGPRSMHVDLNDGGSEEISADSFVLGAGSRAVLPPVDGLEEARPHTSDTIMRMESLPSSLAILGSGVIAVEMAHVFASLGVDVTIIARSGTLLRHADTDVSARLTELARDRYRVITGFTTTSVTRTGTGVRIHGEQRGAAELESAISTIEAEELLVAVGRRPNSDLLDAPAAGIDLAPDGRVRVDEYQRVLAGGVPRAGTFAFGDLSNPHQLKHVANHELRIVRQNLLHPGDMHRSDTMPVPYGVFTHPQVASVGLTEEEARGRGLDVKVAVQEYASIAYGWALEDTTSFAKIIVSAQDGRIIGAHIIGSEATILIQQLVQAMSTGQTAADIARTQYWIHPAMPELIENALLQLVD
jgi:mycothione reductase